MEEGLGENEKQKTEKVCGLNLLLFIIFLCT